MTGALARTCAVGLVLAGWVQVVPVRAAAQEVRPDLAAVQARLEAFAAMPGVPGLSLGIAWPDGSSSALAAGVADTASATPLHPDHLMLQGSVGKTYFSAVALQLVEAGRLDLDVPVAAYLEGDAWLERLPNGRRVTLRHLLSHTSGLVRYELSPGFLAELHANPLRTFTVEDRMAYLFDREAPFEPGEGWEYSDTNYILVAHLIERVTGRAAYDEIRTRFLETLGLGATVPSDRPRIAGLAQGYAGPGNPFGDFDAVMADGALALNPQFEWGGGGFASTARDLARWTHYVQTGRAFGSLVDAYRAGTPAPLGPSASYGLGVIMMELPGGAGRAWGHSGMMPGYRTEAYHFPDHGFTLALQINTSDPAALETSPLRMLAELAAEVVEALRAFPREVG